MYKKEVSKLLKHTLVKAGLNKLRVRGGTGTVWGWIDLISSDGLSFTEQERQRIQEVLKFDTGRTNVVALRVAEWEAILNNLTLTELEQTKLTELKQKFFELAKTFQDRGTCCGGSGLYILKNSQRIQFWRNNISQSISPLYKALEVLKPEFEQVGFQPEIEDGWID